VGKLFFLDPLVVGAIRFTATRNVTYAFEVLKELETRLTTSLDPRSKGRPGTVALARSSGAARHIVNVRYWPNADIFSYSAAIRPAALLRDAIFRRTMSMWLRRLYT
jgi:hypothetical protein